MPSMKCVAIGDSGVGKTCLLRKFAIENYEVNDNVSPNRKSQDDPKYDEYWVQIRTLDNKTLSLQLCDTSALDCYECTRLARCNSADIILICFSVVDRKSFENVRKRWIPELFVNCPYKPTILVGTKTDLIEIKADTVDTDMENKYITYGEGWCMARDIGAFAYIECTALLNLDISIVFDMVIECVQQKRAKKKENSQESQRCPCRCRCPLM